MLKSSSIVGAIIGLTLAGTAPAAESVRVTTWDFAAQSGLASASSPQAAIGDAAEQLKKLAPDVVLLHGVSGWKMADQLAKSLRPAAYRVVACSAFPSGSSNSPRTQVAILARNAAYFSWSEPWQFPAAPDGGFAFAAVQVAGHRFGFSCLELAGKQNQWDEQATAQWLTTLASFRGWANNRLEGFVAAAFGPGATESESGRLLRTAGFDDPANQPMASTSTGTLQAHLVPNADAPKGLLITRWPVTCDFDFRPPPSVIVISNAPAPPPAVASVPPASALNRPAVIGGAAALAGLLGAIVFLQLATRRKLARLQAQAVLAPPTPRPLLTAGNVNPDTSLPAKPSSRSPSASEEILLKQSMLQHLAQWLKQAFVQRLVTDRQQLIAAQQAASMKALAVDERLARLEAKIQEKNASYEKQIEQLNCDLLTARAENRELIRAQIRQVKTEMERNRVRILESEAV